MKIESNICLLSSNWCRAKLKENMHVQGEYIGGVSEGEYIVDIMNEVGYDFAIPGNHEFDYGVDRFFHLVDNSEAQYLACNIKYTGKKDNPLEKIKPYEIVTYGDTEVAYIGISTPETLSKSTPTYFMEDGEFVYNFAEGDGTEFYTTVQTYIDECEEKGADYIILLGHLGDAMESSPYTFTELVSNISGADVVLDAHSHSTVSCRIIKDKSGEEVLVSSTGTKLANIGKVVISASGTISVGLVDFYDFKDETISKYIDGIKSEYEEEMNRVVAKSDIALSTTNEAGIRLVRNRESTIGNFCADAYRIIGNADVGMVKPRLWNDEDTTKAAALWTLKTVLINSLKLLHPYMPFITEEIFCNLSDEESIMISEWPVYTEEWNFAKEERAVETIKEAVRGIRNSRTGMNVPPSRKAKVYVVSEDKDVISIFENGKVFFTTLAYASEVEIQTDKTGIADDAVAVLIPNATVYMPFADLVDIEKEVERLLAEQKKLEGEINRANGMLNNEKFTSKAPEAKIQEERDKLAKYTTMLEQVKERLTQLGR